MRAIAAVLGLLVFTAVTARAEPPRRDPIALIVNAELVVRGTVEAVHAIKVPEHWFGKVEIAEVRIEETWKGETCIFCLRPFLYDVDADLEADGFGSEAFEKGCERILGARTLHVLTLCGAGRMPIRPFAGEPCLEVSVARAEDMLPHLWTVRGPDPRYEFGRHVRYGAFRELVRDLADLPDGARYAPLFHGGSADRLAATKRLLDGGGKRFYVALALAQLVPEFDPAQSCLIEQRLEEKGDAALREVVALGAHSHRLVREGAARLLRWRDGEILIRALGASPLVAGRRLVALALTEHARADLGDDVRPLLAAFQDDPDLEVRRLALVAHLLGADSFDAERDLPRFLEAAKDESRVLRRIAVRALGRGGWPWSGGEATARALKALCGALGDSDDEVRHAAAEGLLDVLHQVWAYPETNEDIDESQRAALRAAAPYVRMASGSKDPLLRGPALAALGGYAGQGELERLKKAAEDESVWIRRCAAHGLGWTRSEAALKTLSRLAVEKDLYAGLAAVESMALIGTPEAGRQLADVVDGLEGWVLWTAVDALGELGGEGAREALKRVMQGDDQTAWAHADAALKKLDAK